MKISHNWLKQYIPTDKTLEEIARDLTEIGLEVEHLSQIALYQGKILSSDFAGLVVGEVLTCEKHPDADKLHKTTINIGEETLPIVCGAPNIEKGQKIALATVGTKLQIGEESLTIKKAKIRGEVSQGMVCSEVELGIGEDSSGILVLDTDLPNGTPISEYIQIEKDTLIEIGLTPNRVDAASHYGVARDLAALYQCDTVLPKSTAVIPSKETDGPSIAVNIHNDACPRYSGISLTGVKVAPSPAWLQNKLACIGIKPTNNIVDITNFVMHELGQPIHTFDADKIAGNTIHVMTQAQDTLFTTLDEKERKLHKDDLMICDDKKGLALAGVFGGLTSGVTDSTTSIFIESAYFLPDTIRKASQRHALKTDAAFRYERGADPDMTLKALYRAVALIKEFADGQVSSELIDIYPNPIKPVEIEVKFAHIDRLIGKSLDKSFVKNTLQHLEINILKESKTSMLLSVPPYRVDVTREVDIIEELLRLYGYNNIEFSNTLSTSFIASFPKIDQHQLQNRITALLCAKGMSEIITNSLTKPKYAKTLKNVEVDTNVTILNKLSEELEVMRQSLIPSGLEVALHNLNRKQSNIKIFEFGKVYHKTEKYQEHTKLALFFAGDQQAESWSNPAKKVDFHYVATILNNLLEHLRLKKTKNTDADPQVFAHGLAYKVKKNVVAQAGLLQDYILKMCDIKQPVYYVELDWDWIVKHYSAQMTYQEINKYPEVRRDLSLVLDKEVTFEALKEKAQAVERKILKEVNVFSVYEGESIGKDKKSYALSFILQDPKQTLNEKLIEKTMQKLMEGFKKDFGAIIRE